MPTITVEAQLAADPNRDISRVRRGPGPRHRQVSLDLRDRNLLTQNIQEC